MTHSNAHSYPLPFPSDDRRILISSYSSLANALGTEPGHPNQQGQRPSTTNGDAVDSQTIYLNRLPVSDLFAPYPAPNIFNSGTYPVKTPVSASNGRLPHNASNAWAESSKRGYLPTLPQRYDRLPQPCFLKSDDSYGYRGVADFPAIHFLYKGDKMLHSLWDLLTMTTMPDLVDGDMPISTFVKGPDRWIKIKLIWPGYPRYPFEKRISVKGSRALTPSLLLTLLASYILDFVKWIENEDAVIELGQERWAVTEVSGGAPAMWKNCVITSLQHVAGSTWRPDIYYDYATVTC